MDNNIHIFFASDNNFVLPLYNALSSILRNANAQDNLNFYILDKDISENNKNKIKNLKKVKPFNIEYIKINDDLFKDCPLLKICGHISLQTYYRYIIPRVKPNLPKVLYLDCDILVKSSLSDLWNIDLKDTYCGAVQELYKDSNIDARRLNVKTYFNAGVLLLNNKKMIEDNTTDELFRVTKDLYESGNLVYQDQDVLNVVFNDNITWMSPRFNYQQNMSGDSSEKIYSQTELEDAKRNVVLVHYNSGIKPWLGNYDSSFFFKDYYMELFRNGFYYKLYQLFLKSAVNNLFSITNIISDGKKFKQITIMGIKIKVKKNSDVQIFVSYHKPFKLFKNKYLQPIHVGRDVFLNKDTCDGDYQKIKKWLLKNTIGDNTSDNISLKNPNYCELTAQYWAWKNCNANYVGFCHYRRLFDLNNSKISKLLNEYDIILPRIFTLDCTVREQYNRDHIKEDLDKTLEIIASKYPDYMEDAENVLNKKTIYFCNMFITNRELFNSYCEWLFDILFELEKVTAISENKYQSRIFGFLSERLLNIFIEHVKRIDDIKICEVPVKFIEENKFSFLQRLFSVTNEGYHKIIMILGMKFKFRNKYKELKSEIGNLNQRLSEAYNIIHERAIYKDEMQKMEFETANWVWRTYGPSDELFARLEYLAQSPYQWNVQDSKIWLVYISCLLEKGKKEQALNALVKYASRYQYKDIERYLLVAQFAYMNNLRNEEIDKANFVYQKLEENRKNNVLAKLLENKTIAIVGNGPSEIGKSKGKEIDSHDIVIRFNNYRTDGFEADYGSKTDIWARGSGGNDVIDRKQKYQLVTWEADYTHWRVLYDYLDIMYRQVKGGQLIYNFDYDCHLSLRNASGIDFPTTGLVLIWDIYQKLGSLDNVDFYGFSFCQDMPDRYATHYFNDRTKEEAIMRSEVHKIDKEAEFLKRLVG